MKFVANRALVLRSLCYKFVAVGVFALRSSLQIFHGYRKEGLSPPFSLLRNHSFKTWLRW